MSADTDDFARLTSERNRLAYALRSSVTVLRGVAKGIFHVLPDTSELLESEANAALAILSRIEADTAEPTPAAPLVGGA